MPATAAHTLRLLGFLSLVVVAFFGRKAPRRNPWGAYEARLVREFAAWREENGLPDGSAEEILDDVALTPSQRRWLVDYIERWDYGEEGTARKNP